MLHKKISIEINPPVFMQSEGEIINNFKSILNERSKDKGIDEDEGNPFHKENNVRETLEFF